MYKIFTGCNSNKLRFQERHKKYPDNVPKYFETLVINRGKDSDVIILSDKYNSLRTKAHELSSKANEKMLDSPIEKQQKIFLFYDPDSHFLH